MSASPNPTIDDPNLLFRFALLLTGEASAAGDAVSNALKNCGPRLTRIRDDKRRREVLFEAIVKHAPPSNESEPPAFSEFLEIDDNINAVSDAGVEIVFAISRLPDPLRVAAAYFYAGIFTPEELPHALGWSLQKTAQLLQQARLMLVNPLAASPASSSSPVES